MIDIHTHLLPGVDDGSPSIAATLPVLDRFASAGLETVVCTPHLRASQASHAPFGQYRATFDALVAAAPHSPRLLLGWEIMLDVPGIDLTDRRLALGGSRAVLVEFSSRRFPPTATEELARLRSSGVVPVVAHPERYRECTLQQVAEWRCGGAAIQVDVPIFGSARLNGFAEEMLSEGLVDVFASDTHVDARSLALVRTWLTEVSDEETVTLLTSENARRLLADEETVQVPPIRLKRGMFQRLRERVLHRH
jgi:protein-tyrosine phosphatase